MPVVARACRVEKVTEFSHGLDDRKVTLHVPHCRKRAVLQKRSMAEAPMPQPLAAENRQAWSVGAYAKSPHTLRYCRIRLSEGGCGRPHRACSLWQQARVAFPKLPALMRSPPATGQCPVVRCTCAPWQPDSATDVHRHPHFTNPRAQHRDLPPPSASTPCQNPLLMPLDDPTRTENTPAVRHTQPGALSCISWTSPSSP